MCSNIKTLHIRIAQLYLSNLVYMFRAIWEFAQSRDCVAHSQNPEIALRILRNLRLCSNLEIAHYSCAILRLQAPVIKAVFHPDSSQSQQTLTFRQTGKVEIRRLRMQMTRSRDCARVLCKLEIGTQSQDSENAPCNLEIAQILRLRGTYICMGLKPRNHANTYMQLYGSLVCVLLNVFHNPCTLHIEERTYMYEETREW